VTTIAHPAAMPLVHPNVRPIPADSKRGVYAGELCVGQFCGLVDLGSSLNARRLKERVAQPKRIDLSE
jgi:hypothetical protein